MAAATTDLLTKVGLPGSATTLDSPGFTIGATSINVASTANWQTETLQVFAMDQITIEAGQEVRVAGSYREVVGIVTSATSIGSFAFASGFSPRNYPAGSTTRVYIPVSSTRENMLVDWGKQDHNTKGNHKTLTDDNGNEWLERGSVTSAVNQFKVTNAITGKNPILQASGDDTNVSGSIIGKGTGLIDIDGAVPQKFIALVDFIESGCVWSGDSYGSTRNASCTAGFVWINGKRLTVAAVTARSFTASKDVYCDLKDNGDGTAVWVYYDNTTNAASPSFATTTGTMRGAIIVVGAGNIAAAGSVNQGQWGALLPIVSSSPYEKTDSLGNIIHPYDPVQKCIGGVTTGSLTTSGTTMTDTVGGKGSFIVPTGGRNITILADIGCNASTANLGEFAIRIDGANAKVHRLPMNGTGGWTQSVNLMIHKFLAAGVHTVNVAANVASGAGNVVISDVIIIVQQS